MKYEPDDAELAGAKVKRDTTFREMRFTEEALQDAKGAGHARKPRRSSTNLSLDTKIGERAVLQGHADATSATAPDSRAARASMKSCS